MCYPYHGRSPASLVKGQKKISVLVKVSKITRDSERDQEVENNDDLSDS